MMTGAMLSEIEDVLWSVTDVCNLNCIYCSVSDGVEVDTCQEPTVEELDHILNELKTIPSLNSLTLSGGEALLSKNILHLLESTSQFNCEIIIITNGVKLTDEAFEMIKTYRPNVLITIDSIDENINCKTRGAGVLTKSLSTLDSLLSIDVPVVVILVVTKYNIDHIMQDLNYYYGKGVKSVLLQQLHCEGRAKGTLFTELSPTIEQIDMLYYNVKEFKALHPDMDIDNFEICYYQLKKEQYAKKCDPNLDYLPQRLLGCGAGYKFIAIKTNGDVIPCNALRSYVLGNLHKSTLAEIFESGEELNDLRKLHELRVDRIDGCATCTYAPICDGGCRADVLNLTGDIFRKHPYCNMNQG